MSSQVYTPAPLPLRRQPPVPTGQEGGWVPRVGLRVVTTRKPNVPSGNQPRSFSTQHSHYTDFSVHNAVCSSPNITSTRCFDVRLYTKRCKHSQTALAQTCEPCLFILTFCPLESASDEIWLCKGSCVTSVVTTPNTASIRTFCWRARPNLTGVKRLWYVLSSLVQTPFYLWLWSAGLWRRVLPCR